MVYSNKFVVCVLVNDTPQNELANGIVKIPFNSEYVLRFRNKNNRRALVKVAIDGENVSNHGFIIPANSYIDVKRPINKDAAFKFVSLDSPDAIDHGKNGPNDDKIKGTIDVKCYLEKELSLQKIYFAKYPSWASNNTVYRKKSNCDSKSVFGTASCLRCLPQNAKLNQPLDLKTIETDDSQDGCTVEGNETGQEFVSASIECEETYTSVKLFLQGCQPQETKPTISTNRKVDALEAENQKLREQIAELENKKLKLRLNELSKTTTKKRTKKSV
jgi:hypothetical protein